MKKLTIASIAGIALIIGACGAAPDTSSEPDSQVTVTQAAPTEEPEPVEDTSTDTLGIAVLDLAWSSQTEADQTTVCDLYGTSPEVVVTTFYDGLDADTQTMVTESDVRTFFAGECA